MIDSADVTAIASAIASGKASGKVGKLTILKGQPIPELLNHKT